MIRNESTRSMTLQVGIRTGPSVEDDGGGLIKTIGNLTISSTYLSVYLQVERARTDRYRSPIGNTISIHMLR